MPAKEYFTYAVELMKLHSPHLSDWSTISRLQRIGIEPGERFSWDALPSVIRDVSDRSTLKWAEIDAGKDADTRPFSNGWLMNTDTMGVYGNYYLKRAIVAMVGLGANQPEDAIYPVNVGDSEGMPMQAENNYVLHFSKDEVPPVEAFWSLTMYDVEGFQVVNPINRFALGDRNPLKFNRDGSLDLFIQHRNPGRDKESNWLPAPESGELGITLRLYAPKLR